MSLTRDRRELWVDGPSIAQRVLIIDDDPHVRGSLHRLLGQQGYETASAKDAAEARTLLREEPFHLVLCDIKMPGESGLELVPEIIAEHPGVAVVMVSGLDDRYLAETALDLGAYDYVIKPFRVNDVFVAVGNALRRRKLQLQSRADQQRLRLAAQKQEGALQDARAELAKQRALLGDLPRETLYRLARAVELHDPAMGNHLERVGRYSEELARRLGLGDEHCEAIRLASQLHDVGKIGVPDRILRKPGPLDAGERALMERHAEVGHSLLTGGHDELLELAATIAWTHHERIDGRGYPRGLAGDAIPLEGRIVAVADAFDALTSDRPYRRARSITDAVETILTNRATQFDSRLVDLFADGVEAIRTIGDCLHEEWRTPPVGALSSEAGG
jgi:putative two-component system response regulator